MHGDSWLPLSTPYLKNGNHKALTHTDIAIQKRGHMRILLIRSDTFSAIFKGSSLVCCTNIKFGYCGAKLVILPVETFEQTTSLFHDRLSPCFPDCLIKRSQSQTDSIFHILFQFNSSLVAWSHKYRMPCKCQPSWSSL